MTPSPAALQLRALLDPLLERHPGGRSWLPALLHAAPHGRRLGALADDPGYLNMNLTVMALTGRPCFQYPVATPPRLNAWFVEHPDALSWPADAELSPQETVLRRALIADEPPGSRVRAQQRAKELIPIRSAFAREWWRFEETHEPDCLLMSDSLVLVLLAVEDEIEPVSGWFPQRSRVHQGLEAARRIAAEDARGFGLFVCASAHVPDDASDEALRATLGAGTPHLDDAERLELGEGYLGGITFAEIEAVAGTLQR